MQGPTSRPEVLRSRQEVSLALRHLQYIITHRSSGNCREKKDVYYRLFLQTDRHSSFTREIGITVYIYIYVPISRQIQHEPVGPSF